MNRPGLWMLLIAVVFMVVLVTASPPPSPRSVSIASWNLQVFGTTKASKPDVMDVMVRILSQYDLIAVQEIRDSTNTAFPKLMALLNEAAAAQFNNETKWSSAADTTSNMYDSIVGPREGRTSSKEQYAFIYKPSLFRVVNSYRYPDVNDTFERPPFAVEFAFASSTDADNATRNDTTTSAPTFIVVDIHTKPDDAVSEISGLAPVYWALSEHFNANPNILTVGDYNCGCSYVTAKEYAEIPFYTDTRVWTWYIPNSADTMISSDCPYDRIVSGGEWFLENLDARSAIPFDFQTAYKMTKDEALKISDHMPVTINLYP